VRAVPSNLHPFFRAACAALLTLALLSSAVQFNALSAAHSCSMPCCAGVEGGCATGVCEGALFQSPKRPEEEEEEEELCGASLTSKAHRDAKGARPPSSAGADGSSNHCDADSKETLKARQRAIPVEVNNGRHDLHSARALLAAPCPTDCCAGASASSHFRRGRDSALLNASKGAGGSPLSSLSQPSLNLTPAASAHLKRLRARAPPPLLSPDSALS
jgi:hypothetical protein